MNRRMVPLPSPGRGVQTLAHGVSHGFAIESTPSPGGAIRIPSLCRPSGTSPVLNNNPWLTPWATVLSALRVSVPPMNHPPFHLPSRRDSRQPTPCPKPRITHHEAHEGHEDRTENWVETNVHVADSRKDRSRAPFVSFVVAFILRSMVTRGTGPCSTPRHPRRMFSFSPREKPGMRAARSFPRSPVHGLFMCPISGHHPSP